MFTLIQSGFAEQTINKSKFLAWAGSCENETELGAFFRSIAAQHPSAHHLAYAFRIKTLEGIIPRFSDAGEPSGTAGKPILQMLDGQNIVNVAIAVVRYYGGVNLGTGGLVRAYGGTAKMALATSKLVPFVEMQTIKLETDYKKLDYLTVLILQKSGQIIDKQFGENVRLTVKLPQMNVAELLKQIAQTR